MVSMPDQSDFVYRGWAAAAVVIALFAFTVWYFGDPPSPSAPMEDMA